MEAGVANEDCSELPAIAAAEPGGKPIATPNPTPARPKLYFFPSLSVTTSGCKRWPGAVGVKITPNLQKSPSFSDVPIGHPSTIAPFLCPLTTTSPSVKSPPAATDAMVIGPVIRKDKLRLMLSPTLVGLNSRLLPIIPAPGTIGGPSAATVKEAVAEDNSPLVAVTLYSPATVHAVALRSNVAMPSLAVCEFVKKICEFGSVTTNSIASPKLVSTLPSPSSAFTVTVPRFPPLETESGMAGTNTNCVADTGTTTS